MNNIDARSRAFNERLSSEQRKWEFRYNNQNDRIKELESTVKELRAKLKELKNEK